MIHPTFDLTLAYGKYRPVLAEVTRPENAVLATVRRCVPLLARCKTAGHSPNPARTF